MGPVLGEIFGDGSDGLLPPSFFVRRRATPPCPSPTIVCSWDLDGSGPCPVRRDGNGDRSDGDGAVFPGRSGDDSAAARHQPGEDAPYPGAPPPTTGWRGIRPPPARLPCVRRIGLFPYRNERMVGTTGFEPATLCSQSRCATRLRHVPTLDRPSKYIQKRPASKSNRRGVSGKVAGLLPIIPSARYGYPYEPGPDRQS